MAQTFPTPMNYYDALEAKAQGTIDALADGRARLKALAARPTYAAADLSALTEKVLKGQAQLDAIRSLQMRLVSDDTVERAYDYAIRELSDLALLSPYSGPDETRRRAAIQVYGDFLRGLPQQCVWIRE